ncbi:MULTISPECIES: trans-aconitate 2-methyltransferase [Thermoactinomyces]|jgi:trans-aconitate methyltransferase|uniref:Methyltransferase domain-containing protein n=1 Tax=Thermoactinomyces daqus TaxID=1329516 RepID=A0A7W2AK78_9BACL|nr:MULTISPECIES: methyltransferase domain-containing protein [Thermoactinomyces]MBA4544648.1 methyltransferase domain-containing protein [Thermoactinomyces daqus]MBH8599687.1 methyltransferase domain-containing protein [Thermoactinomyces sp. CICC 10523]MBH8605805.1 methyltransferase domain-containing protein [Thermoactinomyces sp. CICC 10522]
MNEWNATFYDEKVYFVSKLGEDLIQLLSPKPHETILDLGCGTGDLTNKIAQEGAKTLGIDSSPDMINKAREKYPHLSFEVQDAYQFQSKETFDAVFSNAVLHWIKEPTKVIKNIWFNLKPHGRLVAEFGGKGNVESIFLAIKETLEEYQIDIESRNPWYFPSIGEYCTLLEKNGFRVLNAIHFDRPTPLPGGEHGLDHWLDMFTDSFFQGFSTTERREIYQKIKYNLHSKLYQKGTWVADYKRLRIFAIKNKDY